MAPQLTVLRLAGRTAVVRPPAVGVVRELCRETLRRIVEERTRVELPVGIAASPTVDPLRAVAESGRPPEAFPAEHGRAWLEGRPELALRSPMVPAAPPEVHSAAAETSDAGAAVASRALQPTVPRVDLERLTDEVVRQIDRRLVAHAERVGRI